MLKNFTILSCIFLLLSCGEKNVPNENTQYNKDTVYIKDYNFIISPDLSNRINQSIHPKPVHDTLIINEIVNNIEYFLDYKRQTNQTDSYKFDFINRGILNNNIINPKTLEIDFSKFNGKPLDLSNYIRNNLKQDASIFKQNVKTIYNHSLSNTSGSDIWNYFNETINTSLVPNDIKNITPEDSNIEDPIILKKKENVLILITDGYLETINNSKGYVLNEKLINEIRTEFNKSQSNDLNEFILSKNEFLINKVNNDELKNLNVLVIEIYDRSKDKNGAVKIHPTDFQIMKIIWTNWLKESGVKSIEIKSTIDKKEDIKIIIEEYLNKI